MDGVDSTGELGLARRPKRSSLEIGSEGASEVDCFEVGVESARDFGVYGLSVSLSG